MLKALIKTEWAAWQTLKHSPHRWDSFRVGLQWQVYFAMQRLLRRPVTPPVHLGPGPRYRPVRRFRGLALPGRRRVHWILFPMVFEYETVADVRDDKPDKLSR
jgi:hypothetical protein